MEIGNSKIDLDNPIAICYDCNSYIIKMDAKLINGEYVNCCPNCKSVNIKEINTCIICGEEIDYDMYEDICEECWDSAYN